jgi:hypothetical protein
MGNPREILQRVLFSLSFDEKDWEILAFRTPWSTLSPWSATLVFHSTYAEGVLKHYRIFPVGGRGGAWGGGPTEESAVELCASRALDLLRGDLARLALEVKDLSALAEGKKCSLELLEEVLAEKAS